MDSAPAEQSVKSFKQQLKEAQAEALKTAEAFGPVSKEALTAAKRVAELKDQFKDAQEVAALFDPGAKFAVFGNILRTVAGGFSALTGVMGLFGDKSAEVEKTLLQVQSALAFTEGINTIVDATKDFERFGAVIAQTTVFQKANALATNVTAGAMKLLGISVDTTAVSFKVLKGAIVATGIGALVIAIGVLVEAFDSWTSAAARAEEQQKQLNEAVIKGADAQLEAELAVVSRQEKEAIARAEAVGKSEKEISDIRVRFQKSRLDSYNRHYDEINKIDNIKGGQTLNQIKNLETDIEVTRLQYQKREREKREEHNKKLADQSKEAAKKAKEQKEQELKEMAEAEKRGLDLLQKLRDETYLIRIDDEATKARLRIVQAGEAERKEIWDQTKLTDELRSQLLIESRAKQQALLDEFNAQEEEKQREAEALKKERDLQRIAEGQSLILSTLQQEAEIRKQYAEQQIATEQAVFNQRQELAGQTANILGGLSELFGRNTAASKVAGLAQIAINTGIGFIDGLRIAQQSAKATGPGAALAFPIFYAAQVAAVLGAAARAKAVLNSGSSSASSSPIVSAASSVSAATAPLTPTATVTTTQLDADSLNTIGNATTRAYVVESDVTDQQERIARLSRQARLGG